MDSTPSADGNDQRPVTIGIVTSASLADLLNNNTANNATIGNNDVNLRVASNVITATVFIGHDLVSIPFSFTLIHSTVSTLGSLIYSISLKKINLSCHVNPSVRHFRTIVTGTLKPSSRLKTIIHI